MCIVTTREHLKNIENQATTEEQKLDKLVKEAAIALLRHLQVVGTEAEMEAAWKDAGGHALTLQLLGRFLADAHGGDIRHYKEVKFEEADLERQGRSAFKVMIAYERWLQSAGPERQRELALLRLTGLFDRPMSRDCLQALRAEPAIPGLTDALVKLKDPQWNIALTRLSEVDLLTVTPDAIDAHPLIREYFAKQLRDTQPAAFQAAHSRLFDHLCKTTPHRPDTLDGLQPLYQAVVHGCLAGRQQEACEKVYRDRILRGTGSDGFYSTKKLGAIGADLAAVAAFFDEPWSRVSPNLSEADQAWLLNEAAFSLRALGRLTEALQPMRAGLEMAVQQEGLEERGELCRQPQRAGGDAGPVDGRRGRCPPVDHPRRPERRCVRANGHVAPRRRMPCTSPAGAPKPARSSPKPNGCRRNGSRSSTCSTRCEVSATATGSWPPPNAPPGRPSSVARASRPWRSHMARMAMLRFAMKSKRRGKSTLDWRVPKSIRSSTSPSIT